MADCGFHSSQFHNSYYLPPPPIFQSQTISSAYNLHQPTLNYHTSYASPCYTYPSASVGYQQRCYDFVSPPLPKPPDMMDSGREFNQSSSPKVNRPPQDTLQMLKKGFPAFDGSDVRDWIFKCEQFFRLNAIDEDAKVRLATIQMSGRALQWHYEYITNRYGVYPSWSEYSEVISKKFSGIHKDLMTVLLSVEQVHNSVEDTLALNVLDLKELRPLSQLLSKDDGTHHVFDEMPDEISVKNNQNSDDKSAQKANQSSESGLIESQKHMVEREKDENLEETKKVEVVSVGDLNDSMEKEWSSSKNDSNVDELYDDLCNMTSLDNTSEEQEEVENDSQDEDDDTYVIGDTKDVKTGSSYIIPEYVEVQNYYTFTKDFGRSEKENIRWEGDILGKTSTGEPFYRLAFVGREMVAVMAVSTYDGLDKALDAKERKSFKTWKFKFKTNTKEEGELVAYGLLRKEWFDCFNEIHEVFTNFMENVVCFDLHLRTLRISYQLSVDETAGIILSIVLDVVEVISILDYGLAKAADLILKHVITPTIVHASIFMVVEDSEKNLGNITEATLLLKQSSSHKIKDLDGDAIYSGIFKVFTFICSSLCFGNIAWIHSFGRLTRLRMSDLIIFKFPIKVVPEDASKLADLIKIKRRSQFEATLKEVNFVSPPKAESRLSEYAENVEVHMINVNLKYDGVDYLDVNSSKHVVHLLFSSKHTSSVIECFDFNTNGNHKLIGKTEKFTAELERLKVHKEVANFVYPSLNHGRNKVLKGQLILDHFVEKVQYNFLDYISSDFKLNFMDAVDFTASNGNPRTASSLHYIDLSGRLNSYQKAIKEVGELSQFYDSDKHFPAWDFGGRTSAGPTLFSQVVDKAVVYGIGVCADFVGYGKLQQIIHFLVECCTWEVYHIQRPPEN